MEVDVFVGAITSAQQYQTQTFRFVVQTHERFKNVCEQSSLYKVPISMVTSTIRGVDTLYQALEHDRVLLDDFASAFKD